MATFSSIKYQVPIKICFGAIGRVRCWEITIIHLMMCLITSTAIIDQLPIPYGRIIMSVTVSLPSFCGNC